MRGLYLIMISMFCIPVSAQHYFYGNVTREDGVPIADVNVIVSGQNGQVATNQFGYYEIKAKTGQRLIFSHIEFSMDSLTIMQGQSQYDISLKYLSQEIQEVLVNTGYQYVSKDRVAGSFNVIDNELLSRSASGNLLDRLENITSSLAYIRRTNVGEQDVAPELRLRGMSTIFGDGSPLIILDNFPYEGDINNINPDDIENVTILKDASAASIWGARAGNGVIVISTKGGKKNNRISTNLLYSQGVSQLPNLTGTDYGIGPKDFMEVEKQLYRQGWYNQNSWTVLSPYIERLIEYDDGTISKQELEDIESLWSTRDFMRDLNSRLYRNETSSRMAANLSGSLGQTQYYFSLGHDNNNETVKGNGNRRTSVVTTLGTQITKGLRLDANVHTVLVNTKRNGTALTDVTSPSKAGVLPYLSLSDEGVPYQYRMRFVDLAEQDGLLNWSFNPLNEINLRDITGKNTDVRLNLGLTYDITPSLSVGLKQLLNRGMHSNEAYFMADSYEARNMVNRYTTNDGKRIVPYGGVSRFSYGESQANATRVYLNFDKAFSDTHHLVAFIGAESNEYKRAARPQMILYGIDDNTKIASPAVDFGSSYPTRPQGTYTYIPTSSGIFNSNVDRARAYFSTISYTIADKYAFSTSARIDKSNLFGVKQNQKAVPLWSLGAVWDIKREKWLDNSQLSQLRLRSTLGENGNVDKSLSAYPTAAYSRDPMTGLLAGKILNTGNPSLRWEKIQTWNVGLDLAIGNEWLYGSVEFYKKRGMDLIGDAISDPTTGIDGVSLRNRINYAETETQGWDIDLTLRLLQRAKWKWMGSLLLSKVDNQIVHYDESAQASTQAYLSHLSRFSPPQLGLPQNYIFSYPWHGLDNDGNPLVLVDGDLGTSYAAFLSGVKLEDLVYGGPTVPNIFGSYRNTIDFGSNLTLSILISYKGGYFFRRPSLSYYEFFEQWKVHEEFNQRWQKDGASSTSEIPGFPVDLGTVAQRDQVYQNSKLTIESGNHVRLDNIQLSYRFKPSIQWLRQALIQLNVDDLGIIWKETKSKVDPDIPQALYRRPLNAMITMRINL